MTSGVSVLKNGIETSQELDNEMQPGHISNQAFEHIKFLEKHCIEYLNCYGQEGWDVIQIERQIKDLPYPYPFTLTLDAIRIEDYTIKCMLKRHL